MLETPAIAKSRPDLLGLAVPPLVELAFRPRHCTAGNGHPVAPEELQALLAMEVAIQKTRPTED